MLNNYFSQLKTKSTLRLIIELALIIFLVKVPVVIITELVFKFFGRADIVEMFSDTQVIHFEFYDLLAGLFLAPWIETIFGQWLPIVFGSMVTKNKKILMLLSSFLFMFMHYPVITFFPAAFTAGLVLSWSWIEMRKISRKRAFFITSAVHFVHNLLAFLAALVFFSL